MATPLVSIVIPCYNAAGSIAEAIESAICQTYANTEIIVIDDGSDDSSLEIIRGFDGSIRWKTGPNRGGGAARNLGLAMARGEFIQFLDADDVLLPECVARKVEARLKAPELCPCCDWRRVDEHGGTTVQRPSVIPGDPVVAMLAGQMQTSSPLHQRRDLEGVNGFDERLACSQDRDLHLRLACAGVRFSHLNETLFVVRRRAGSVSHDFARVLLQRGMVFSRLVQILEAIGRLTSERRFAIARALALDGRRLFHRGFVTEAKRHWGTAAALDNAGLRAAYNRAPTRGLLRIVGPELTESVVMALAACAANSSSGRTGAVAGPR